jgi:hypothetical protein
MSVALFTGYKAGAKDGTRVYTRNINIMGKHKNIDWRAIKGEYRGGQLSIREIARQYKISDAAIRKRARAEEWERDLADRVREEARNKLIRCQVASPMCEERELCSEEEDREIVESAANRAVGIIKLHRKDAKVQLNILRRCTNILKGRLEGEEATLEASLDLEGLRDISQVNKNASSALKNLVYIERQAYGLDTHDREGVQDIKVNIINFSELSVEDGGDNTNHKKRTR